MARPATAPRPAPVLTKALLRAADGLGVNQRRLGAILGVSEATISRLGRGKTLDPADKPGELAVLFLRLYRSLDTLVGGDAGKARSWLWADNRHLGGIPAERIASVAGLVDVVGYLDAMRGKL
ncbi:MAG TPA: antitoxin Xre-like helix-turn-helix domain-containing protein [Candidatus Polarisedimenticolaceae bacterium]|nr:antitoxin Xre-like helix-turn-helix domain-containing protein [Candidatus Polarisedimenticolaceae bacterium]